MCYVLLIEFLSVMMTVIIVIMLGFVFVGFGLGNIHNELGWIGIGWEGEIQVR